MAAKTLEGIIIKGIGGFYYVKTADAVYCCKARGLFRKQKITPLPGDTVTVSLGDNGENTIDAILPRKNFMIRPPAANVGRLVIISSAAEPAPVLPLIDRLTAIAVNKTIEPVVVFSKSDLADTAKYINIYKKSGIPVFSVSCVTHEGIGQLKELLSENLSVFTGNSGVGKSSLLNEFKIGVSLKTGEISQKLGRGRHTTREVELFPFGNGYIADTPGFSALETEGAETILKEELPFCFPEFLPYLGKCRFSTCTHTVDKGCKVIEAVKDGLIDESRHESYKLMYREVKDVAAWNL